jgi:hypothetical protein
LWQVHQVAPTGARLLVAPKPVPPPARTSPGDPGFAHAIRNAETEPAAAQAEVIDVEVLWEDGEEAYAPPVNGTQPRTRSSYRGQAARLRLYEEPGVAIAAYRSAASTAELPHQTIDLFA